MSNILIAEDSMLHRKALLRVLESLEYSVLVAQNGREALEYFLEYRPRIVITDLEMPVMDGFELIKKIRSSEVNYTHITVLSSLESKQTVVRSFELGADDYLVKPFHPEELTVRIAAAERMVHIQSQEQLIMLMAKLTDYRSPETGWHIERVQQYTRILGENLLNNGYDGELNQRSLSLMYGVSTLHDIGKIAIPDEILNKPGRLTSEEYERMKTHAAIGGRFMDEAYRQIPSEHILVARDITLYHHERYDGTGYPHGLAGTDIPLSARIVALADVFDAISSERVYKPPFPRDTCRQIILEESGKHFDPELVAIFLEQEQRFWDVKAKYPD